MTRATRRSSARLSAQWLYRCGVDHPHVLDNKVLVIVSPAVEGHTPSGVAFGSASGHIYQNASRALRHRYAVPYEVFAIEDFDAKYYAIMRFAIAQPISLLITPNPTTILRLVRAAETHRDQLVRDVRDGTLTEDAGIPLETRRALRPSLRPNAARAKELERLASDANTFTPEHYWPQLALGGRDAVLASRGRRQLDIPLPDPRPWPGGEIFAVNQHASPLPATLRLLKQ